jgi:hypothetical protein
MQTFSGEKECGTTHCIGGWAEAITGKSPEKALGLTRDQAHRLFYVASFRIPQWPKKFLGRKRKNMSVEDSWWMVTPRQAAARIEWFIKTEGRE